MINLENKCPNIKPIHKIKCPESWTNNTMMDELARKFSEQMDNVCIEVVEKYLGRPIDYEKDKGRIGMVHMPQDHPNDFHLVVDGVKIGFVKSTFPTYFEKPNEDFGYRCTTTFTPAI